MSRVVLFRWLQLCQTVTEDELEICQHLVAKSLLFLTLKEFLKIGYALTKLEPVKHGTFFWPQHDRA